MKRLDNLKLRVVAVMAVVMSLIAGAEAAKAGGNNATFGVEAGYNSRYDTPIAGIFFNYDLDKHFRLGADAELAFRHEDYDALLLDVDAHFPFQINPKVEVFPLAGVSYSAWSHHLPDELEDLGDDVTERLSRFGINIGGGVGIRLTQTLKLNLQARYTIVEAKSGVRLTAGIGYIF